MSGARPDMHNDNGNGSIMQSSGTVKWFDNTKGYGFVTPDEGGADCFVHHSNVVGTGFKRLAGGQRVDFQRVDSPRGPLAEQVVPHPMEPRAGRTLSDAA